MTDDVHNRSVDELELSIRTSEFVKSLGVETIAELVELPVLELPEDTPARLAPLMAGELRQALEALGIEYRGEIRGAMPTQAKLTATGTVAQRWATIESWLRDHHPHALAGFNPPASADAIDAAEDELGVTLPDDYKAFLLLHDGQDEFAPWVGLGALLPIAEVVRARDGIFGEDAPVPDEQVGKGVRAVDYSQGWIPITRSARGRDYLCLDLDPAPAGARGQIIEYVVDNGARPLVAKSFADLLSLYFEQAQSGELDLDAESSAL